MLARSVDPQYVASGKAFASCELSEDAAEMKKHIKTSKNKSSKKCC